MTLQASFASAIEADRNILDRLAVFIDEAPAEIAQARSIDYGAANDVSALVEREPFGYAVVHFHAAVGKEVDRLLAVEPPYRRPIDADSHAGVLYLTRAVDHRHGPEYDAVSCLVQPVGETKELDVEARGIQCMPHEFLLAYFDSFAIVRNHRELVGEVLVIQGAPHVGVGKHRVRAVRLVDRFQKQPSLQEAVGVRRFGDPRSRCEIGRERPRSIAGSGRLSQTISSGPDCRQCEKNQWSFHFCRPSLT